MNETLLRLQGWIPHRLMLKGDVGYFLYNQHNGTIINRKTILYNETVDEESYRIVDLRVVPFGDIPRDIIEIAINLGLGKYDK